MAPLLCKDCVFLARVTGPPDVWPCMHPSSVVRPKLDLVTGELTTPRDLAASYARTGIHEGSCGPRGQFWQPLSPAPLAAGQLGAEAAA